MNRQEEKQSRYIFLLSRPNVDSVKIASEFLRELGVKVLNQQAHVALIAKATTNQVEAASRTGLFLSISKEAIETDLAEKLSPEQGEVIRLWNTTKSQEYYETRADRTQQGISWGDRDKDPHPPHSQYEPEEFKKRLLVHLGLEEKELYKKYGDQKPLVLEGKKFIEYERELAKLYDDPTIAYHLARIVYYLEPQYTWIAKDLTKEFLKDFFHVPGQVVIPAPVEPACWKMENEISVGVVFVESSQAGGPTFSTNERNILQAEIMDGLDWLADEASTLANLTWVYDWQFVTINVANGTNTSNEDYWRNPAMGQVTFRGNTYSDDWAGVSDYREAMRLFNRSSHAIVIFVTPYATRWHAYASSGRVTLANRNNWGGWGINVIDAITAHEVCHLFGASDEYTGSGTPCSSCNTIHGCYNIPNGNCGSCARPQQACIMDANSKRLCAYTQGHIGWADLFVELTTADVMWAGTDDSVWLDIGDRPFILDTPNHNDRERNNVEGYALNYTGLDKNDIKRVGIRKSSDGFAGGWKLKRVRSWLKGELICDANNINQWLEDEYRWWACTSCGSSSDIINRLQVKVTTANVMWAGTDDDVSIHCGGRSWNLDNPWHNDFERGNTDTFDLDPSISLYQSMLHSIRIHKSPDGFAGGWKLKGLQIYADGVRIYNNQNINKWLEDNNRDWYGSMP